MLLGLWHRENGYHRSEVTAMTRATTARRMRRRQTRRRARRRKGALRESNEQDNKRHTVYGPFPDVLVRDSSSSH